MEENNKIEDNNTVDNSGEEQEDVLEQIGEDEEERSPRSLLPFKTVLLLIVVVVALAGGWLFLQQERTIQIDKDLTGQVAQEPTSTPTPSPAGEPTPVFEPPSPQVKILDTPVGYLNVRTRPSVAGGEVVGRVQPGQTYEYLEEESDWYYIVISEEEKGWVFSQYVEEVEAVQPIDEEEVGEEVSSIPATSKVRILQTPTGYLNVRNTSSVNGTRIGRVQPLDVHEYTDKKNDWYHIIFGDNEKGWVSGEYVEEL